MKKHFLLPVIALLSVIVSHAQTKYRSVVNFDKNWKFYYADTTDAKRRLQKQQLQRCFLAHA